VVVTVFGIIEGFAFGSVFVNVLRFVVLSPLMVDLATGGGEHIACSNQ
jgi:hypothetical protein